MLSTQPRETTYLFLKKTKKKKRETTYPGLFFDMFFISHILFPAKNISYIT